MNEQVISFRNRKVLEKSTFQNVALLHTENERFTPLIHLTSDAFQYVDGFKDIIITVEDEQEKYVIEGACCFSVLIKSLNYTKKIQLFELFREGTQIPNQYEVVVRNAYWDRQKGLSSIQTGNNEIMCTAVSEYVVGKYAHELLELSKQIGDTFNNGLEYGKSDTNFLEYCLFARDSSRNDHQINVYGNTKICSFEEPISKLKIYIDSIPNSYIKTADELCLVF